MTDRLCIICNERKAAPQFERKGEHIVPRFLGNRRMRTPFVCRACNGGLGGTVDVALKGAPGVAAACFNCGLGWARGDRPIGQSVRVDSLFEEYCGGGPDLCISKNDQYGRAPLKNPAVLGAILKIAYESAHLRLGDGYLGDPIAAAVREILSAFVSKDKDRAYGLIGGISVYGIDINAFYAAMRAPRREFVKKAIAGKSCLNSIWVVPLRLRLTGKSAPLAVVMDIEGIPPNYAVISESPYSVDAAELIFPGL